MLSAACVLVPFNVAAVLCLTPRCQHEMRSVLQKVALIKLTKDMNMNHERERERETKSTGACSYFFLLYAALFFTVIYATCPQKYVHAQNIDKILYMY